MADIQRLNLYGNQARWLVDRGMKLLTLRLDSPKYAKLQSGCNIIIQYESDFNLGVVFSRQVKPLKEYSPAELLLDGYSSSKEAARDMVRYPGYEKITVDTPLLGIGFSTPAHFMSYLDEGQRKLLFETPLDKAVRMIEFRDFFMPSFLGWAIWKNDLANTRMSISKWHHLLIELGVADSESLKAVSQVDQPTQEFYRGLRHTGIRNILNYESTVSPKYKSVVLCQPVSVSK